MSCLVEVVNIERTDNEPAEFMPHISVLKVELKGSTNSIEKIQKRIIRIIADVTK